MIRPLPLLASVLLVLLLVAGAGAVEPGGSSLGKLRIYDESQLLGTTSKLKFAGLGINCTGPEQGLITCTIDAPLPPVGNWTFQSNTADINNPGGLLQIGGSNASEIRLNGIAATGNDALASIWDGNGALWSSYRASGSQWCPGALNGGNGCLWADGTFIRLSSGSGAAQVDANDAEVSLTGAVRLVGGPIGSRPACAAPGGQLWRNAGGPVATDTLYVCLKSAANTYSWVSIVTGG